MPRIEAALYSRLSGFAGVSDLVGTRIYPLAAPDDAIYPLIRYQRVQATRLESLAGPSGLSAVRFQIDAFGQGDEGYRDAGDVAEQIRLALDGFGGTVAGVVIQSTTLLNERDQEFDEGRVKAISQDFRLWHREA